MICPHCQSPQLRKLNQTTSLGYAEFRCGGCRRKSNERSGTPFNFLEFPTDIVFEIVLCRLRYKLSLRNLAEMYLLRLLDRSTRLNREPQTAWRQEWRIINADGSGATKASSNQFNDSKGGDKIMECKEAGSETHQQEHRFESPRAARQTKPFAEWCSRARVRFAAPSAPLPTPRHSASNQDRDGRLRRELKSLALWNFPKAAGLRPAMVMEFILTSAAFSWKARNRMTAFRPVLRSINSSISMPSHTTTPTPGWVTAGA